MKKNNYGFTLVELMIGIAIIAILAATAIPAIKAWIPNYRLKAAGRNLFSTLQKVRLLAVKKNSTHAVLFDTAAGTYQILSDPGPNGTWDGGGASDDTNAHPGPDGVYGTGDDIPERPPTILSVYGSGIAYEFASPIPNATAGGGALPPGGVSYANNIVVFNSRGMLAGLGGYVYLSNNINSVCAIGTPTTTGNVVYRKWFPGSSSWD